MKRFLITVFLLAMLILTLAVVASAAPQFYLADNKTAVRFENGSSNITVDRAGGAFTILPSTRDPMITIGLSEEEQFDAEEYPIVAFKMSAKTVANVGGFFFGTSKFPGPQGDEYSQFNLLDKEGNMCDYIVDMTSFSHGRWTGTVNKFRIDPINSEDLNATIVLDRLGFFKTKEEAEAFLKSEAVIDTSPAPTPTATPVTWDFENNAELIDEWSPVGGYSSAEFGFLKVTSTSTDVSISTTLSDDEKIDTSKLKYFAYRYWAKDVKNSAGLFFTNQYITSMSDKTYTNFNITGDKRWRNTIYDMSSAGHGNWKGTVDKVRLDVSNPSLTNSVVYISKIGFFSTFEEASAFLADSKDTFDYSTEATLTADYQYVSIPANTLSEGFDENDYLLKGGASVEHGSEDKVVEFTDANGNSSIVPVCDVSSLGFAKYIAQKPGTYKLIRNTKEYVDTNGHWGKEYIDYVSSRKLFGGTSETEFSPDMTMTRGMFITVLGRMHGVDTSKYDANTGYGDVNSKEYYAPYIAWAKENNLMAPINDTSFAPEEAILRKDMALVIYNYINAYGYEFDHLAFPMEFTDISACTADQKNAIEHIQGCGIINGIGNNLFNPDGSSTRAEVATVMQRVIKSILGNFYYTPYDADYFKRDRIRIGTWGNFSSKNFDEEYMKTYYEGGFDWLPYFGGSKSIDVLNYAAKYGVEVYLADGAAAAEEPLKIISEYFDHPAYTGSYLRDEPGTDSYDQLAAQCRNFLEATNGEKTPYINLLPMYANAAQLKFGANAAAIEYYDSDPDLYRKYCQSFVDKMPMDYICTDIYPMRDTIYSEYIESINIIATVARENDKTFWCFFHGSNPNMPTKEFSWQIYSLLSFGCKGFLYWIWEPWAIDENGNTTSNYEAVKPVMLELRAISDVYIQYKNLGAFNHNYSASYNYLKMSGQYKDFKAITEINSDAPLLFGCFEKKDGSGTAFTVVNMYNPRSVKAAEVKVKLDGTTVTSYYGGTPTLLTADADGYYTIKLGAGEGVFVTID